MSIQEYTNRFNELVPYAKIIVPTELDLTRRYEGGFNDQLAALVVGMPARNFNEAYNRALHVSTSYLTRQSVMSANTNVLKRPISLCASSGQIKKARFGGQSDNRSNPPTPSGAKKCFKCHKVYHPGYLCDGSTQVCYNCKMPGHFSRDCIKPRQTTYPVGAPISGSGSKPRVGTVFVMTKEEAAANPGLVTGTSLFRIFSPNEFTRSGCYVISHT